MDYENGRLSMPCGAVVERQQLMEIRPRSRTSNARFPPFVSVVTNGPNRTFVLSTANDRPKPKLPDAALYLNGKNAPRAATKSVLLYLGKFGYRSIAARYMQVLSMEVN
jgi:hypothetical protein